MNQRIVWLASYPKSGSTWIRAILTAIGEHPHLFGVNRLHAGWQPHHVGYSLAHFGLDARWLDTGETDQLRSSLIAVSAAEKDPDNGAVEGAPLLRKTHERFRRGVEGREPFPIEATRAAIHIIRDPRDVACSLAPFFGISLDEAIDVLCRPAGRQSGHPALCQTAEPWGTWSTHARSWAAEAPFPVHLIRFEDLHADPVEVLAPILDQIGLRVSREVLSRAVESARFDRLRDAERQDGFRETSHRATRFFRRGEVGAWRDELSNEQVETLESRHAVMMTHFGYARATPSVVPELPPSEARVERGRVASALAVPAHLGLSVRSGPIPKELPGARRPRPWLQVAEGAVLIRFQGGARLLVVDGTEVTLDLEEVPKALALDPSWIVQGWAVTLASLQRGQLSLHASTVRVAGRTVAIAGGRGAGKSTTAMGLRGRGHILLADDVALIGFDGDSAWMQPFARNVHLLPDAAAVLGVDFAGLPLLSAKREKAAFLPESPPSEPQRIDHIIVLAPDPDVSAVRPVAVRGAARIEALAEHASRDGLAEMILGEEAYFRLLARLANCAPVHLIERPTLGWSLDGCLDSIESVVGGVPRG